VDTHLEGSPPFASQHRPALAEPERRAWEARYRRAGELEEQGRLNEAVEEYRQALEIDDLYAELHFRLGRAYLALGRPEVARGHLVRSRDLDALRFRADSQINRIITETVAGREEQDVYLIDGERILGEAFEASGGLPGDALFYEHVHLNYRGTYELARALFERVRTVFPKDVAWNGAPPPAAVSRQRCAELLALTDRDRYEMASTLYGMVRRAPFTNQLGHESWLAARRTELGALRLRAAGRLPQAESAYRRRLVRWSEDLLIREKLARVLQRLDQHAAATGEWRRLVETVPGVSAWETELGFALAEEGRLAEAAEQMGRLTGRLSGSAAARVNLGTVREQQGDLAGAEELYRQALAIDPLYQMALFNLGALREGEGRFDEAAEMYSRVLRQDPGAAQAYYRLGAVFDRQGRLGAAIDEYRRSLALDPDLVVARNNLGFALQRQGKSELALAEYRRAVESDPTYALAVFNLGDTLLASGRVEEAVMAYQQGLLLRPDHVQARYNLAAALQMLSRDAEAAQEFRQVLERQPESAGALNNLALILATAADSELRDGPEAVGLAQRARKLTESRVPEILETLAMAYAASERFPEASALAVEALELARSQNKADLVRRLEERAQEYGARRH
jgi:tetratricopeptide (TPR) repeat protein